MPVGAANIAQLLEELRSDDVLRRAEAADSVLDWIASYSTEEGTQVGRVLVGLAQQEKDPRALEALLHALAELAENGLLGRAEIIAGAAVGRTDDPSVAEYLDYLQELAATPPSY